MYSNTYIHICICMANAWSLQRSDSSDLSLLPMVLICSCARCQDAGFTVYTFHTYILYILIYIYIYMYICTMYLYIYTLHFRVYFNYICVYMCMYVCICYTGPFSCIDLFTGEQKIKGPDDPTSQLLPKMIHKCCRGDGEGRKDKGCDGGSTRTKNGR